MFKYLQDQLKTDAAMGFGIDMNPDVATEELDVATDSLMDIGRNVETN